MNKLTGALLVASLAITATIHANDERAAADAKYAQDRASEAAAQRREAAEIRATEKEAKEAKATPTPTPTPTPKAE